MSESIFSFKTIVVLSFLTSCGQAPSDRSPVLTVLDNGLRLIVVDDPSTTIVSVVISVHSGAVDEDSIETGAAHFLEHVILFRGTERRTGEAVLDSMRRYGAYFNGHTSHDWTTFEISVPVSHFLPALTLLHEMLFYPRIDDAGIEIERSAILEELQRYEDNPVNMAFAMAQPLLFDDHPYGRTVIGTPTGLRKLSGDRIRAYYRRQYVPNNMSVVVTGNVRKREAIAWIQNIFTEPPGEAIMIDRSVVPVVELPKDSTAIADVRQAVLMWSAVGPAVSDESMAAVDLLTYVLAEGESSWLHDLLRTRTNWVNEIHADVNKRARTSVIFIYAGVPFDNVERVTLAMSGILDSLAHTVLPDHEIDRARNQIKTTFELEMERSLGRSSALAQVDAMEDFQRVSRYRQRLDEITSQDAARAGRLYFSSQRFALTAVLPR